MTTDGQGPVGGEERALRAVARVRGVRERDSRLGLGHALRAVQDRAADLDRRERALQSVPLFSAGPAGAFFAERRALAAMATEAAEAAQRLEAGRTVAAEAMGRWQDDRARLRSVELLAERRAERLRDERRRVERRESDEVAAGTWLREHPEEVQP